MAFSQSLAYYHFARTRGRQYVDDIRPWLQVAFVGSAATKYLGLTTTQSVLVGLGIMLLAELAMLGFGWFDHHNGIIRAQQQLNNLQDPYRVEMLARAAAIERLLTRVQADDGASRTLTPAADRDDPRARRPAPPAG